MFFGKINTQIEKNDYLCSRKFIEVMKKPAIIVPEGIREVLLHACCAPCSSAIVEWIDGDYNHEQWREDVCGLENEPERGRRCEQCFTLRLIEAAKKAKELGIRYFTTTLASSRWKSLEQIERAGHQAEQMVDGTIFWAQNWRKGGLYERRNQLLKEFDFYNQQYCGCEFSVRNK